MKIRLKIIWITIGLLLILLPYVSGTWASPSQSPDRQTVPTRGPSPTPAEGESTSTPPTSIDTPQGPAPTLDPGSPTQKATAAVTEPPTEEALEPPAESPTETPIPPPTLTAASQAPGEQSPSVAAPESQAGDQERTEGGRFSNQGLWVLLVLGAILMIAGGWTVIKSRG